MFQELGTVIYHYFYVRVRRLSLVAQTLLILRPSYCNVTKCVIDWGLQLIMARWVVSVALDQRLNASAFLIKPTRGFLLSPTFGGAGPFFQRWVWINNAEMAYDGIFRTWLNVEITTRAQIKYFSEGQIHGSCPPCAKVMWISVQAGLRINIYITPLSKTHLPDSLKNLKYFSRVWRSTIISKKEQVAGAQRHTKTLQAGI